MRSNSALSVDAHDDETGLSNRLSFMQGHSLEAFTYPRTGDFWTNCHGRRLHIRSHAPGDPNQCVGVNVLLHGFSGHMNGARIWEQACHFGHKLNMIVFTFDFAGHGYSEGERAQVHDFQDLATDAVDFVRLLFTAERPSGSNYNLCSSAELLAAVQQRDLILVGESMGAAAALFAALQLHGRQLGARSAFRGAFFFAPCFALELPPAFVTKALTTMVEMVPVLARARLPAVAMPAITGKDIFRGELDARIFDMDREGEVKGALGCREAMTARTATSFLQMLESLPEFMSRATFPFIIVHDPKDKVTSFNGSKHMMQLAPSPDKQLISVPGALHAPHFNKLSKFLPALQAFAGRHCRIAAPSSPPDSSLPVFAYSHGNADPSESAGCSGHADDASEDGSEAELDYDVSSLLRPALQRWGTPQRVAPMLNVLFLLGHALIAASPFYLLGINITYGTYILMGVVLLYALSGVVMLWCAARVYVLLRRRSTPFADRDDGYGRHLVCVAIYKESDDMVLSTLSRLNQSNAASRMRVVLAMEEATDRPKQRYQTYKDALPNVPDVVYYIHPAGRPGEIRGLCSNIAFAMRQDVPHLIERELNARPDNPDPLRRYTFTKVDSQVLLPLTYFEELDRAAQLWLRRSGSHPVVWQPMIGSFLNRGLSHGACRALCAMRAFAYGTFFSLSLMVVTCYSLPLPQYVEMGLHHPGYMGEDAMVLAQSSVATGRSARVEVLPVLVGVAPPLDATLLRAILEASRQGMRWAAQTAEVAEFRWRHRAPGSAAGSLWWVLKYWWWRVAVMNGLGVLALSLPVGVSIFRSGAPEVEAVLLSWMPNAITCVLSALVLIAIPLYEQLLARSCDDEMLKAPFQQLPLTILSAPAALLLNNAADLLAYYRLCVLGKNAITLTHRKKVQLGGNGAAAEQAHETGLGGVSPAPATAASVVLAVRSVGVDEDIEDIAEIHSI